MRPILFLCLVLLLLPAPASARADDPNRPTPVDPKPADGDAPLARGFPAATGSGKVEIKSYPAYRSAVARVDRATMSSGDMMFFSLFNHIQRNQIEMTAPVINTYMTPEMIEIPGAKGEVTMEFVYREPTLGKTGKDGVMVDVVDHPPGKYLCLGVQGAMTPEVTREGVAKLGRWLDEHKTEWVADGPPRRIGYHGPMTPTPRRLWEVQIPVKPADGEKPQDKRGSPI